MKKFISTFSVLAFVFFNVSAQNQSNISFEASYLYGNILKHNKHLENLVKGSPTGVSVSVAWQTEGKQTWNEYWNFPVFSLTGTWVDLSNPEMLGNAFAFYPSLQIPIIRCKYLTVSARPGAGLALVTRYYSNSPHQENTLNGINGERDGANGAIGSMLNVFLAFGGKVEVPVAKGFSLTGEYAWNHISNGMTTVPNSGINMMNIYAGLKFTPDYQCFSVPKKQNLPDVPRNFSLEFALSGGVRQLYYKDNKSYGIAAMSLAVYRPLTNWYKAGFGIDGFYNGVFGAVNFPENSATEKTTDFQRTFIATDKFENKIRIGASLRNEFMLGRFIAGFHFGMYLHDPIKSLEPVKQNQIDKRDKGLIYNYDIDKEDGWFYMHTIAKYDITQHIFVSVGLKTHLQKAEFIDWGVGYRF